MARKKHRAMGTLMKYLGLILFFYILYCALLFVQQRRILFPRHLIPDPGPSETVDGERIWLSLPFGRVEAWFLPPVQSGPAPAPAVIFAHGNAELIDYYPRQFDWFRRRGMALLLVEYPGYGRSDGSPSRRSISRTFQRAYDHLADRPDVDPERIVFLGRSVGSAVAAELALTRRARAMALVSPFTSVRAMARGFLAPPFLILDPFDTRGAAARFEGPLLVIHGKGDSIVPLRHGRTVAQAAPRGRLEVYDCDHNDCPPDWERFFADVEELLVEAGVLGRSLAGETGQPNSGT